MGGGGGLDFLLPEPLFCPVAGGLGIGRSAVLLLCWRSHFRRLGCWLSRALIDRPWT